MNSSSTPLTPGKTALVSMVVLILLLVEVMFLQRTVKPLPTVKENESTSRAFEMVSVVLGLLAGGCMAGYFSFDYGKIHVRNKRGAMLISWLFIGSIYILTFLVLYALRRAGALHILDRWASFLLFLAVYGFSNGMVLFEFWKSSQFKQDEPV